jgi:AcrR family transcriptional regulator
MGATARQIAADDTRKRLFASAVALFGSAGYHATTVDAIARRAGCAKGTFFVHFATKDAVVIELVRRQTRVALDARAAALPAGPAAALRATVLALGAQASLSRELSRAVLAATLENRELAHDADALFGLVLAAMTGDAKAIVRGAAADTLARGLMAAYLGAAYHFASTPSAPGMTELLEPIVDTLLQGLSHAPSPRPRRR